MVTATSDTIAYVFPGQGSQKPGMGAAWAETFAEAKDVFDEADRVLGLPLSRLCFEGPEDQLNLTANTQPALLTVSTAIHRVLCRAGLAPVAMAGHSLGEWSALVAAGALAFEDALKLVRRRGELMQQAVPPGEGAMAAVMTLDAPAVEAIAEQAARDTGRVCTVANYNSPLQSVLAGHREAVARAMEAATAAGARKVTELPVSAPFHSPLMAPAREAMAEILKDVRFDDPTVPVVTNVDVKPVTTGADAKDALIRQIDSPVRWTETIQYLAGELGVDDLVEVGPGKVLSGLARRTVDGVQAVSLSEPRALEDLLGRYGLDPDDWTAA